MTDSVQVLYKLAHFSSLIEVSVGINLVFSFWESLRNIAVIKFTELYNSIDSSLAASLGDSYRTSRSYTDFDKMAQYHLNNLRQLSMIAKWVGMFSTAFMLILLVTIGLNPDYTVNGNELLFIIAIAVIVSPTFLLFGNIYVYFSRAVVERFSSQIKSSVADIKNLFQLNVPE